MTPLGGAIAALIAAEGPMPVSRYVALCLGHPRHGYYMTRDPFGVAGDFVTAPEISQIFGELIGLWAATVWRMMGEPGRFRLVELGPGRGTLMADALRAARIVPGFAAAASVHLVETSPVLRRAQAATLAGQGAEAVWHQGVDDALDGPAIVIANEFLDALPLDQFVRRRGGWHERLVGLDAEGALVFGLAPEATVGIDLAAAEGSVLERPHAAAGVVARVGAHLAAAGGAALFIDYGAVRSGFGDTLQAVRRHGFADPLAEPGEADLTVQVDFAQMAATARAAGAAVHGPVTQAAFLESLGIAARVERLIARATPEQARGVAAGASRLVARGMTAMGELFKVLAVAAPGSAPPPGFDTAGAPVQP